MRKYKKNPKASENNEVKKYILPFFNSWLAIIYVVIIYACNNLL